MLDSLNFKAELSSLVATLSGGEQQKVAITRAIIADSKIILLMSQQELWTASQENLF